MTLQSLLSFRTSLIKTRLFTDFFEKMNIIFTSSDLCSDGFLGFILAYKKDIISFPCYGI